MRFLTVADRELRAASRRQATYRVRWITAVVFFALLVWLLWAFDGFTRRGVAGQIFHAYAVLAFIYCIIIGAAVTADCLSAERREGTLGLLFLTNLNSAEIIAGKFCSTALTAVYGLAAIFPMLALPLLMGGTTLAHFWKTILALVITTFFSMSAGFVASVICRRQFMAIAFALGLSFVFGAGVMGVAAAAKGLWRTNTWADELAACCPLYTLVAADGTRTFGTNYYWSSIVAVSGISLTWLSLVTWRLAKGWRDKPKGRTILFQRFSIAKSPRRSGSGRHIALRRRLLNINPFFWLGEPRAISSPSFMVVNVVLVAMGALLVAPYFSRVMTAGVVGPVVGHLFGWLWIGLTVHLLTAYFAAMSASQRMAEDKQAGALELILSTPTSERTISRGLWLAFARRMFFPALLTILIHCFFIWQFLTALMMEIPAQFPRELNVWQIFWRAVFDLPLPGDTSRGMFTVATRSLLLALGVLTFSWITLGWVGRWLGLHMKNPGFAPIVSLALVFVPPTLLFSIACYVADELQFDQWPEQQFISCMMWIAVVLAVGHFLSLIMWAHGHLRRDFRAEALSRYQPLQSSPWWWRSLRLVRRLAITFGFTAALFTLVALLLYGYGNWRSHRRWAAFEKQLKQQGQSIEFQQPPAQLVPDDANFASSPAFEALFHPTNSFAKFSPGLRFRSISYPGGPSQSWAIHWHQQKFLSLAEASALLAPSRAAPLPAANRNLLPDTNRTAAAIAVLKALEPFEAQMRELSASALRPYFQIPANRRALEQLNARKPALEAMEKLQSVFLIRASAALELKRTDAAAEDVMTSLRLAGLARQSIDVQSTPRAQAMLLGSLQPLWEGLARHQWNDAQLAEMQKLIGTFNFLSDYANAVQRVTRAYMEVWQEKAREKNPTPDAPIVGGVYHVRRQHWQPGAWWLDYCVQIHEAGQHAIAKADVAAGRIAMEPDWSYVNGLPIDVDTQTLLLQPNWGPSSAMVAFAQSSVGQAVLACALERSLLARGYFPETLEELRPDLIRSIPKDPVRGRPMSYERIKEREYILRSVGPNELDDRTNTVGDDWLWSFPTNALPIK